MATGSPVFVWAQW